MAEHLTSMYKAPSLIHSTIKKKNKTKPKNINLKLSSEMRISHSPGYPQT